MALKVVGSGTHPSRKVDPFGIAPCRHRALRVHITSGETMGEDLVECRPCGWVATLKDLYVGMFPAGGPPGMPTTDG